MCHLASIPVRCLPDLSSEMVNQLLFGETFEVLKEHDHYRLIRSHHDGYEGWVDGRQTEAVDGELLAVPVIALESGAAEGKSILKGSTLPDYKDGTFRSGGKRYRYDGPTNEGILAEPSAIIAHAASYLGSPYLWGGRSPYGIDCSGFVQVVWRAFGGVLPRDASQQIAEGESIASLAETQPGDLVFLRSNYDGSPHVGLVYEDGKVIHASAQVRIDRLDERGVFNDDTQAYSHDLKECRRIVPGRLGQLL